MGTPKLFEVRMQGDLLVAGWRVQPGLGRIEQAGQSVYVRARVMDLLVYFAAHPGEVVSKDDLLRDVWGTEAVSESALTRTIAELRQALGDDVEQPSILETIPKRGYRLIAPVTSTTDGATHAGTHADAPPTPRTPFRSRSALLLAGSAASLVVVAILAAAILSSESPDVAPAWYLQVPLAPAESLASTAVGMRLASGRPVTHALALSPDGRQVAFAGVQDGVNRLFVKAPNAEGPAVPVPTTEGAATPFFSPDGAWIAFWSAERLRKVPAGGGPITDIAAPVSQYVSGSWGEGDQILLGYNSTVRKVSAAGGAPEELAYLRRSDAESIRFPQFINGSTILYTLVHGHLTDSEIVAEPLRGGERTILWKDGADARVVAGRYLVFIRAGTMMAAPFNGATLQLTGPPVAVLDGIMQAHTSLNSVIETGAAQYAVSNSGHLVYASGGVHPEPVAMPTWFDRQGNATRIPIEGRPFNGPRLSPDGSKAVFYTLGRDRGLFVYDFHLGRLSRIRFDGRPWWPVWTPDGRRIVFNGEVRGSYSIYEIAADGSRPPERLTETRWSSEPGTWATPDDLLFTHNSGPGTTYDISGLNLRNRRVFPVLPGPGNEMYPAMSPDGKWLAYVSSESKRQAVYVSPYPALDRRFQVSGGGHSPVWTRDGRELLFYEPTDNGYGRLMSVTFESAPSPVIRRPSTLFQKPISQFAAGNPLPVMSATGDGSRILGLQLQVPHHPPAQTLEVIVNWVSTLSVKTGQRSPR